MGYTISFRPRKELYDRALSFAEKHTRQWGEIVGLDCYASPVMESKHLSYDDKPGRLGINYSALSGVPREYIYTMMRFFSIRTANRFKGQLVYFYDERRMLEDPLLYDANGIRLEEERDDNYYHFMEISKKEWEIIEEEFTRLAKLWDEELKEE